MESERNELRKLIDAAQTAYDTITEQWKRSERFVPLNLKKETVSSIAAVMCLFLRMLWKPRMLHGLRYSGMTLFLKRCFV